MTDMNNPQDLTIRQLLEQMRALAGHENFIDSREAINNLLHEADRRDKAVLSRNMLARERLADYAHEAWSGWMRYMFTIGTLLNDKWMSPEPGQQAKLLLPEWAVDRWQRQMKTPYAELPESEKASDRNEADKMLEIIKGES